MSRRSAALAGTLAVLLAHALLYRFLCDDAFISFRYARNLASGDGLVFNPGFERVEGYTNFLWVLLLAGLAKLQAAPERAAPVLSLLLTVALWGIVARAAWRWIAPAAPWPFAVAPLAALAITRSVAVWSTSGLETRLFEVLVVGAVVRLVEEVRRLEVGETPPVPWAALLLALASLTRPDGILVAAATLGAAAAWLATKRRLAWTPSWRSALAFAVPVGAHILFRVLYYGAWLPNTYYAKVGGQSWWGMGGAYLAAFALEYGVVLWVPLLILGARAFVEDGRGTVPLLAGAVVLPHALYVASIGGDHFEYRPLDLYFPFAFLLMGRGLARLSRVPAIVSAGVIAVFLVALPWASHASFPKEYELGFPGRASRSAERKAFLDPSESVAYRWPGLRSLAGLHRRLLDRMTSSLVGIRQEEHAMFLPRVIDQGRALRRLVDGGRLPQDTHLAIAAVGAIPYYSGLRTLDRLGLTDAGVARLPAAATRVMAHERYATVDDAAKAGVDLWSVHPYLTILPLDDDTLLFTLESSRASGEEAFVAEAGERSTLVVVLPSGAARLPALGLRPLADPAVREALVERIIAACRARLDREPQARDVRSALATALKAAGRIDAALVEYEALGRSGDADGWYNAGTIRATRGELEGGIEALRRAVEIDPSMAPAHHNLGMALARLGRLEEARTSLREAVRLDPSSHDALFALGAVALGAGDREEASRCRERLEALGTPAAQAAAARLGSAL